MTRHEERYQGIDGHSELARTATGQWVLRSWIPHHGKRLNLRVRRQVTSEAISWLDENGFEADAKRIWQEWLSIERIEVAVWLPASMVARIDFVAGCLGIDRSELITDHLTDGWPPRAERRTA